MPTQPTQVSCGWWGSAAAVHSSAVFCAPNLELTTPQTGRDFPFLKNASRRIRDGDWGIRPTPIRARILICKIRFPTPFTAFAPARFDEIGGPQVHHKLTASVLFV